MNQTRITILLALAMLASVGAGSGAALAWTAPPQDPQPPVDEPVVVRLYVMDRSHLEAVSGALDIWETYPNEKYAVAAVTPAQYQWLTGLGYRLEIDAAKTALLAPTAALDPRFYYFDGYYPNSNGLYVADFLQDIQAAYPDLTALYDIGDAWMAGQSGQHDRDIWVLRITNEHPAYGPIADKPVFFLFAAIHAREVATPELAIRYIKYLTMGYDGEGGYGVDPDVTWLVDHNVAYVLVMQNPDGHWKNEQDIGNYRRKNMDWDDGCSSSASWGVDLNRNHSFLWSCCGGSSSDPCDDTYRGPSRGSEPETQAFQNYFAAVMRDQNGSNGNDEIPPAAPITTTGIFISLHSYSDLVLWPWAFDDYGNPPNYAQLTTIGRKFAYYNGYAPSATIWYDVDGATDDWTYGKFGIPSYTFEVGPSGGTCGGFFPPYGCIDGIDGMPRDFWAENKPTFLYAHKIARTPYATAYGPDAGGLVAAPSGVPQGASVQLTAAVADHRYSGDPLQPIVAAEYFVDAPPGVGEDGAGIPMAPTDGGWGEPSEDVAATVDTSGLAVGRHYLLAHGQNDDGDWGPLTAVFLDITFTPDSAITGAVRDSVIGAPIAQADVSLLGEPSDQLTTTGPDGVFYFGAYSGTYTLAAVAYGYHPTIVTDVAALTGLTTTQTISLTALSEGALTGRVTQAETGLPLAAIISAASDYTTLEASADPTTGLYSMAAFSDTYTVTARAAGHVPAAVANVAVTQGQTTTQDLVLQPRPCVLLVDDDGGRAYEGYFRVTLEQTGIHYRAWEVEGQGSPTADDMVAYTNVLWFTGDDNAFDTLSAQDRTHLTAYLNGGGGLLLTGAEIGAGNQTTPFYADVLHTQFVTDDSGSKALTGGGPFAGLDFSITGGDGANNQTFPDAISPIFPAVRVFTYTNGRGGGVAVDAGTYRAINLGFGVEGVDNAADRLAVVRNGLAWLGCPASPAQLQLSKTVTPVVVYPSDLLTYTLTLTNNSIVSATHVVVTDVLPAHTAFTRASGGGVIADGVVAWDAPALSPLETLRLTLVVTVTGMPAGAFLANADYGARSDQSPTPTAGPPATATVLCDVFLTGARITWTPAIPLAGTPATFTAIVTGDTATLPVTHVWDFGDGGPLTAGNPATHTYAVSGTYHVVMTAANACGGVTATGAVAVFGEPDITVEPLASSAILNPDDAVTRILEIRNQGTDVLGWALVERPDAPWLDESPLAGTLAAPIGPGSSVDVAVVFDAAGLADGVYTATLQVHSNDPDEPQIDVSIVLTVTSDCIPAGGADLTFTPAAPQAGETITLTGSVWQGTKPITYTWDFGDGGVGSGRTVTHAYAVGGAYRAVVTAVNVCGVVTATRDVVVRGGPDIIVDPLALSAALAPGATTTRMLSIRNAATATDILIWSLAESPERGWLDETAIGGTLALPGNADVLVTFDATGLITDVYTTTLQINSNDPDEPRVNVGVVLTVTSRPYGVYLPIVLREASARE